jgi:hypothetical protein
MAGRVHPSRFAWYFRAVHWARAQAHCVVPAVPGAPVVAMDGLWESGAVPEE